MNKRLKMSREEFSWVLYDVGNSAFVLVIITALMPIFFKDLAAGSMSAAESTANWGFANSTASFILAMLSPVLGAMADYKNRKKHFFLFFLFAGIFFTLLLPLVGENQWLLCLVLFVMARVGWSGANVFYDAFLVDVTSRDRMDLLSSKGFAYGYIGSVIPFALILWLIFSAGMEESLPPVATKTGFVVVACWWFIFSVPAVKNLRQVHFITSTGSEIRESFHRLVQTVRNIRKYRQVFLFLAAYFFYIDGVGTIISMSTVYGRDIGFGATLLIVVLLFIQVVAFPFALLFGRLARVFSTKRMLFVGIIIYCLATLLAFMLPSIADPSLKLMGFWCIAFLIASAMGGIQALSRSFFGKLIPAEKSAEFFGFYNIFGKFAAISGPLMMGVITRITGESRWGVLSIMILFVLGGILLTMVNDTSRYPAPDVSSGGSN